MVFRVPLDKLRKWQDEINEILRTGQLRPAAARKLAGKLSWGTTAVFQQGARVYLAPLFWQASQHSGRVSVHLRRTLE